MIILKYICWKGHVLDINKNCITLCYGPFGEHFSEEEEEDEGLNGNSKLTQFFIIHQI